MEALSMLLFRSSFPPAAALAALALLAAPVALAHGGSDDHSGYMSTEVYPTDACAAAKLRAAARYCNDAIGAWQRGDPSTHPDARLTRAREKLSAAWSAADATSAAAGVSCEDTTATADEMIGILDTNAADLAAAIATSGGAPPGKGWHGGKEGPRGRSGRWHEGGHGQGNSEAAAEQRCESRRLQLAARTCRALLGAQAYHLLDRAEDRDRSELDSRLDFLNAQLATRWTSGEAKMCVGGPTGDEAVADVGQVVDAALYAGLVSPRVSTDWTMVTPDAQVSYQGKTLEPICSEGTPWVFFVKRGTVNKTLMYYQGGGACWDYFTCSLPTEKTETGPDDNPSHYTTGFANLSNPDNPFKDWNVVFVPYCTGDVHWGDAVQTYTSGKRSITIHHKGYVNAQVAEKWAREHFVEPDQVFVTGSSAGAYGAIVNSLPLQEYVWPSSDFSVLGDAGNGVITQDFLENDISRWGVEQNLPSWIPALDVPLTELNAADLWSESALFYPNHRFANYATAYDGGQGGQIGFYNIMLNPGNPLLWYNWWPPSCEWNAMMRSLVQSAAAEAPNYRYYIGTGSRHTMWGSDKVYTDTTGGVPTIVSWIRGMLAGDPTTWTNVECTDCGVLLPGDPKPDTLPNYPYTADGNVDCSQPPP
jgi:hypothetical protein